MQRLMADQRFEWITLDSGHHRLPSRPHHLPKICSPNSFSTQDVQLSQKRDKRNQQPYLTAKQGAVCHNVPSNLCEKKKDPWIG